MNNTRRKEIDKALELCEKARSIIDTCATDERESYEALSAADKEKDKGEAIDASALSLEEALDTLDNLVKQLTEAKE